MFTYNIKIYERNAITSVKVDSLSYTLKLDESLDSGVLTIPRSTRKAKFNRFSRVEISINDSIETRTTTWLIYTTKVEIESKGVNKTYSHTIGLIEPTKWLEKFVAGTLTFTQPLNGTQKTLYDYFERVRQLVPLVERSKVARTRLFRIDDSFKTELQNVIAPQMYLDKKNLREVLIELCKVVNAIPRLYYDNGWVLTGDFINQRQLPITIGDGDIDYVQEASGENFAQSAEIFHENTLTDKAIYEGTITDYISFRNNNIVLGENDLRLILSQNVSELISFQVLTDYTDSTHIDNVDLNDYIKEKRVYDTLEYDNGIGTQSHTVYWTYKSNEILGFSEKFGEIFENAAIENILNNLGSEMNTFEVIFKVVYKPYYETMRSVQYRDDFEPYALTPELLDQFSGLIINQGERINELYDLTENIYGQIQRIGVDTVAFSKKVYRFQDIYNIGDYTLDGYFATKIEIIPYTTYFIARYELSKNWNRIAQFIQIDKEFRPYEVSLTKTAFTLKRDILMNIGFVEVSTEIADDYLEDYNSLRQTFLNTFKTGEYSENITALSFKPNFEYNSIVKPVGSLAEKNALKWKLDLLDTKLAGKRVTYENLRFIQKAVNYTDTNGEIDNIRIALYHELWKPVEENIGIGADARIIALKTIADTLPLLYTTWKNATESLVSGSLTRILETTDISIYHYDTYAEFPDPSTITAFAYYVDDSTDIVYYGRPDTLSYQLVNYIIAKKQDPIYELNVFRIYKDSAELIGLEIALPVVPRYDLINTFVIGNSLLKENTLIKVRSVSKTLYFYGLTSPIEKTKADKINLATASQLEAVNSYVSTNYISVPASATYGYDYFAIADSEGNLYLGVNQKVYGGIKTPITKLYFNFVAERTYPDIAADNNVSVTINMYDESVVEYTVIAQEFYKVNAAFRDSDSIVATASQAIFLEYYASAAFRDSDRIDTTAIKTLNTLEPSVSFVGYTFDGIEEYTFNFTVRNLDETAAEIFASTTNPPTASRGFVASQALINVSVITTATSITLYARAKATGENYSTVDSSTGSIY